mmetsp:Transcript_68087/g.220027  ORF Transcript_68087/g.220027 Transcript_68087/m.220027 type:complete len:231 (-) Transcript_68087:791-1483(-)
MHACDCCRCLSWRARAAARPCRCSLGWRALRPPRSRTWCRGSGPRRRAPRGCWHRPSPRLPAGAPRRGSPASPGPAQAPGRRRHQGCRSGGGPRGGIGAAAPTTCVASRCPCCTSVRPRCNARARRRPRAWQRALRARWRGASDAQRSWSRPRPDGPSTPGPRASGGARTSSVGASLPSAESWPGLGCFVVTRRALHRCHSCGGLPSATAAPPTCAQGSHSSAGENAFVA